MKAITKKHPVYNNIRTIFSKLEIFLKTLKRSSKQIEGSFDNTAGKVWTKGQTFTVLSPKMIKKYSFVQKEKHFSWKSSFGHVDRSFDNPIQNCSPIFKKLFGPQPENHFKKYFFLETTFPQKCSPGNV